MTDSIDNMKAFITTVHAGSFSQAGRLLGLAPSVITKRVSQLEWKLHATLFTRTTRKLELTEIGEKYVEPLRQIVRAYDDVLTGVKPTRGEISGHIRLKVPASRTLLNLAEALSYFQILHPRIYMDVILSDRTTNPLEENFDVALSLFPGSFEGVVEKPLFAVDVALCASPDYLDRRGYPQGIRDLVNHECAVFSSTGRSFTFEGPNGVEIVPIRPRFVSNSVQLQQHYLVAGNGIGVVARDQARALLESGQLIEVLPDYKVPTIWLKAQIPDDRIKMRHVKTFLDFIEQKAREAVETKVAHDEPTST